jgi:hypothetical protein
MQGSAWLLCPLNVSIVAFSYCLSVVIAINKGLLERFVDVEDVARFCIVGVLGPTVK